MYYSEESVYIGRKFVSGPGTYKTYYSEDIWQVFLFTPPVAVTISSACILSHLYSSACDNTNWLSLSRSHLPKCHNNGVQELSSFCLFYGNWVRGGNSLHALDVRFSYKEKQHSLLHKASLRLKLICSFLRRKCSHAWYETGNYSKIPKLFSAISKSFVIMLPTISQDISSTALLHTPLFQFVQTEERRTVLHNTFSRHYSQCHEC